MWALQSGRRVFTAHGGADELCPNASELLAELATLSI
jgi:hypothetical protein